MLVRLRIKGNIFALWWEGKLVQPLWKTVWRVLKKLKIELRYNSAIALLGIYPKDTDVSGTCTPMFRAAPSNNSPRMEKAQMSID